MDTQFNSVNLVRMSQCVAVSFELRDHYTNCDDRLDIIEFVSDFEGTTETAICLISGVKTFPGQQRKMWLLANRREGNTLVSGTWDNKAIV